MATPGQWLAGARPRTLPAAVSPVLVVLMVLRSLVARPLRKGPEHGSPRSPPLNGQEFITRNTPGTNPVYPANCR